MKTLTEARPQIDSDDDLGHNRSIRCDKARCPAQASVRATKSDLRLYFCVHHGKMYAPTMIGEGWIVTDKTNLINEKPSPSANKE